MLDLLPILAWSLLIVGWFCVVALICTLMSFNMMKSDQDIINDLNR